MKFVDVDETTELTFLHCLHDERPDDPRVMNLRKRWYESHRGRGLRAKVLKLDSGEVVALAQYLPIEQSHLAGDGLLAILCMWVHGYEHHVGNRQGNGYGRYMLDQIEGEARAEGFGGVVAWGMDFPYWNPVSFYEHMGYERSDRLGMAVLVWKRLDPSAAPPAFRHDTGRRRVRPDRVSVTVFLNGWCMGACSQCITARDAVAGLECIVDYAEIDTSEREVLDEWGIPDGVYVDGQPHRAYEPPCSTEILREDILAIARAKGIGGDRA